MINDPMVQKTIHALMANKVKYNSSSGCNLEKIGFE